VIGIIAMLIAILLPVLAKARAAANRAVCLSNIRQLGIGILMYCNSNRGWFPTCAYPAGGSDKQMPDDWIWWQANRNLDDSPVAKLLGSRGEKFKTLLRCPADTFEGDQRRVDWGGGQGPYLYSYDMNDAMGRNDKAPWPFHRSKIIWWRAPAKKILLTEDAGLATPGWNYGVAVTRRHGTTRYHGHVPGYPPLSFGAKVGTNVSAFFIDGHGAAVDQHFAHDPIHDRPSAR
jgi:hypothetical protein